MQAALEDGELEISQLLTASGSQPRWEHARRILVEELGVTDAVAALRSLPEMLEQIATTVERSKAKDDDRGVRIIDDYAEVHINASADPVVRQTWEETRRLQAELAELVTWLETGRPPWEPLTQRQPTMQRLIAG